MMEKIKLNNGYDIPLIGIGPGSVMRGYSVQIFGKSKIGQLCNKISNRLLYIYKAKKYIKSVVSAINTGYRLIDYSAAYGSEKLIAKAIQKSGVEREDLFVTSRITNHQQLNKDVRTSFFESLKKLELDYIDFYMFHWPVTGYYEDTWLEMVELYKEGYIRALGVANCHQHHIDNLIKKSEILPTINQVEVHPLFTQKPLIEYCSKKGIIVEGYTAIARFDDRLIRLPALKQIAQKYNKSIVQIVIRWHLQNKVVPIIRSSNKRRQLENISVFDFQLTKEEMLKIDSININSRLRYDPDNCDFSVL
ncbi:aldo/keto reductase [Marinifilum flexuosum]|uniref:Diketogulonate reductase-like aldo/keto reductase n=1 Tax=Marinifilum flexuosum TaxID=1117708 RepID=A0A419XA10_9BACT|nr:aldo/keto reductase [Marinifilum flexuosum]RKE04598.1 diketogulonate reductase-like aldo/keto reductase [Marinifilum flexuosum]